MYYVYILKSEKINHFYTGSTNNLKRRFEQHNNGKVISTKRGRPWKLIYYEAGISEKKAREREKYLKTSWGKRYLKGRI